MDNLGEGSGVRSRKRRSPADRTRRIDSKPHVDTFEVKEVVAIWELTQQIIPLVVSQAYWTTRRR